MNNDSGLTFTGRIRSIRCALKGVRVMIASQHNAWLHAAATVAVAAAGLYFGLDRAEWCWVVLAVISVWTAEALNTAFEFLTDWPRRPSTRSRRTPRTWRPGPSSSRPSAQSPSGSSSSARTCGSTSAGSRQ